MATEVARIVVEPMAPDDWPAVADIYGHGLASGHASFETAVPAYGPWDRAHHRTISRQEVSA